MPVIVYYTTGYVYFNAQLNILKKLIWKCAVIKCQDSWAIYCQCIYNQTAKQIMLRQAPRSGSWYRDTSLLKLFRAFLYLATDLLPKRRHGVVKLLFYRDTDACVAAP